jgi:hypothetical protein
VLFSISIILLLGWFVKTFLKISFVQFAQFYLFTLHKPQHKPQRVRAQQPLHKLQVQE